MDAQPTTDPTILQVSRPDWSTITEDILCPLCEYNLRGVSEPRCPECGYRFEWSELLDPDHRRHAYLFEHHASRNLHWFRKTLIGGLYSDRFWRALQPVQQIHTGRLLLYALIAWLICIPCTQALLITEIAGSIQERIAANVSGQASSLMGPNLARDITGYGSLDKYKAALESFYPTHVTPTLVAGAVETTVLGLSWSPRSRQIETEWPLFVLLWPVLTLGALLIFQISMRRAKIRTAHVLRCVVYSFDALVWMALVNTVVVAGMLASLLIWRTTGTRLTAMPLILFNLTMAGYIIYRLVASYRLYLRFDHPILTILASQVIAGLAIAKLCAILTVDWVR